MINTLIVDDFPAIRDGLELALEFKDDIKILKAVSSGREMMDFFETSLDNIDVVILDIGLPDMDGLEVAEKIIESKKFNTSIIIYSMYTSEAKVGKAIKIGVDGYLDKLCQTEEIYKAIKEVEKGKRYYSKRVMEVSKSAIELMENMPSKREWEVIKEVDKGLLDKEIGDKLNISTHTVNDHTKNLRKKYKASTRTELLHVLRTKGLI